MPIDKAAAARLQALFAAGKVTTAASLLFAPKPKIPAEAPRPAGPPHKLPDPGPNDPWMDEVGRIHRPKIRKKNEHKRH